MAMKIPSKQKIIWKEPITSYKKPAKREREREEGGGGGGERERIYYIHVLTFRSRETCLHHFLAFQVFIQIAIPLRIECHFCYYVESGLLWPFFIINSISGYYSVECLFQLRSWS